MALARQEGEALQLTLHKAIRVRSRNEAIQLLEQLLASGCSVSIKASKPRCFLRVVQWSSKLRTVTVQARFLRAGCSKPSD